MDKQKPVTMKPESSSNDDVEIGGDVSKSIIIQGDGNTIHMSGGKTASNPSSKKHHQKKAKTIDPSTTAIIVAIISIVGVIGAALINTYGKELFSDPTATPVPATVIVLTETTVPTVVPTNTATVVKPTFTLIPKTDTPVPTFTVIPPVAIGEDWLAGCISTLWKPYPESLLPVDKGNGCWREPVHAFSAENGDLDFLYERPDGSAEIYGLFAPLPESGIVTFTLRLKDLSNVDLWMGIFAEPDLNSQGLLMAVLNGDVSWRSIVQKDPHTYETLQGTVAFNQGNGYSISFMFNTLSARSRVNPSVFMTNQISIPSTQKWLFLGYKGLKGQYRIEGTFLNFELK